MRGTFRTLGGALRGSFDTRPPRNPEVPELPNQLHIRTPDWTKDGRNYTDGKTRCGQDIHTDAHSGRANRINTGLIDTPIQYQRAYERMLYAIASNNMCSSCQRHQPASSNPPGSTRRRLMNAGTDTAPAADKPRRPIPHSRIVQVGENGDRP